MTQGFWGWSKIPELKKRILFVLSMLAVYRFGIFVSTPGVDVEALQARFDAAQDTILGLVNMFSGGALEQFSIFSLGIMPYISVSIIVQLLTPTIPSWAALKKEGESGQRVLTRYTRQGTIALALVQGAFVAWGLQQGGMVRFPGTMFIVTTAITLTAGTAFIMWLGEQITERGIGNGSSIIIFAGIVARMPEVLLSTVFQARTGELSPITVLVLLFFTVASVAAIVYVERSFRKIPIQYPRRMVGKAMTQAQSQYMPLKVNIAGVIPPIFASAFLVVPATVAQFSTSEKVREAVSLFQPGSWGYTIVFVALIILFCFFYTSLIMNPEEVAENLKKNQGFIPSVRPGKPTEDYLYGVLNRLTLWGSIYISLVCIVPQSVYFGLGAGVFAFMFGGTAILISVGVTLDTFSQIESFIVARNYEMFMAKNSAGKEGGVALMGNSRRRLIRK